MTRARDLVGERFGRLIVTANAPVRIAQSGFRAAMQECVCDCGMTRVVYRANLMGGKTTSCGCWTKERAAEAHNALRRDRTSYENVHYRLRKDHSIMTSVRAAHV